MEINVGDYVRTKDGIIAKCIHVNEEYCFGCVGYGFDKNVYKGYSNLSNYGIEENVIKHSKDIIDLILKGDVVVVDNIKYTVEQNPIIFMNKLYITRVDEMPRRTTLKRLFKENKIQSILTHEQFLQNAYVLEKEQNV